MQTDLSKIWTQASVSISYNYNYYITSASFIWYNVSLINNLH